jgi:Ser/Thr protein kinase RdoA (MazF antagonist)
MASQQQPGPPGQVLAALGVTGARVITLKDVPGQNASWQLESGGRQLVLRGYHPGHAPADLAYEHAVLAYLRASGWVVPEAVSELTEHEGRWYCLTRFVPGAAVVAETAGQQRQRGADLARLHLALRELAGPLGQRPGWQPQHLAVTVRTGFDWESCVRGLAEVSPRLGDWAQAAAADTGAALHAIGARELPLTVIHGDFATWNVHYERGLLAGVIDFGLTHLDSRPFELAIARTYRAPGTVAAYRLGLARSGWPLSDLEETALQPVYRAFRVGMVASELGDGMATGHYDLAMIERQLARTGTAAP